MRFPFVELPGLGQYITQPVIPVAVEEFDPLLCLVDSGSQDNRMPLFIAEAADVDLSTSVEQHIIVGGIATVGRASRVTLRIGDWIFEASVSFCDPWPWDFGLLGLHGFFRYFDVRIDPDGECVDCEPLADSGVVFAPSDPKVADGSV
jgi:hypothetical protein